LRYRSKASAKRLKRGGAVTPCLKIARGCSTLGLAEWEVYPYILCTKNYLIASYALPLFSLLMGLPSLLNYMLLRIKKTLFNLIEKEELGILRVRVVDLISSLPWL